MHIDLAGNTRVKPESVTWAGIGGPSLTDMATGETRTHYVNVTNNSLGPVKFEFKVTANASAGTGNLASKLVLGAKAGDCTTGTNLISSPVTLLPEATQSVCLSVSLPTTADAGSTANVVFNFPATQVP